MNTINALINAGKLDNLLKVFNGVEDKRKDCSSLIYPLDKLLLCILLSMMVNHLVSRSIELYLQSNIEELFDNGIYFISRSGEFCTPSKSTISEVLNDIDCKSLIDQCVNWLTSVVSVPDSTTDLDIELIVSVDGKCISPDRKNATSSDQNSTYVVSSFDHKNKVMLGATTYQGKKGSESKAVKSLLTNPLISCFTADCLHTTLENLTSINSSGKYYVFAIKNNTKRLLRTLNVYSKDSNTVIDKSIIFDNCKTMKRKITVYKFNIEYNDKYMKKHQQCGIKSLIVVERTTRKTGVTSLFYYLTNSDYTPYKLAKIIRGHWHIENNLHWDKDVIFLETKKRLKNFKIQVNRSTLLSLVISVFRINTSHSVNQNISLMANNITLSLSVLGF
jgi:predicted transposase YbfD/YdcC